MLVFFPLAAYHVLRQHIFLPVVHAVAPLATPYAGNAARQSVPVSDFHVESGVLPCSKLLAASSWHAAAFGGAGQVVNAQPRCAPGHNHRVEWSWR